MLAADTPTQPDASNAPVASSTAHIPPVAARQFKHYIFTADDDIFNPDRPRRKRPRIKVACSACKTRKVKCTGRRPICEGCEKNNVECIYRDAQFNEASTSRINVEKGPSNDPNRDVVDTEPEVVSTSYCSSMSPARRIPSPDFFNSLAEHLDTLNACPSVEMNTSGPTSSPLMLIRSPKHFQAQLPGSVVEPHITTKIRVPYFRWFGPTGIVPGFRKVLVDLRPASSPDSRGSESSPSSISSPAQTIRKEASRDPTDTFPSPSESTHPSIVFDEDDDMVPKSEVLDHLLHIFFDYFGCHFPFYDKDRFMEMARSKSVPAVLLNTMCALASRFSHHPDIRKEPFYLCGERFGDKAKQLIFVLLAVPSYDLVASLLMLSWYEFGCNRDVGFWMYTGMAIRMAQDLGMHKEEMLKSGRATREGSTGRPLTLRDEQISCPLPSDGAFYFNRSVWPNPFPHLLRIMIVQGKVNEEISTIRQPEDFTTSKRATLFSLQNEIIQIYTSLDIRLSFNVANFQDYVALGLGGSFLQLHVWFHAVIITLHRPGLMFGIGTLAHTLGKESLEVSMSSANTITSILGLAELIDDKTIAGSPFLNQAIYIAGLAFIAESEMHQLNGTNDGEARNGLQPVIDSPQPNIQTSMTDRLDMDSVIPCIPSNTCIAELTSSSNSATDSTSHTTPVTNKSSTKTTTTFFTTKPSTKKAAKDLLRFATKRNYETCLKAISTLKRYWRGIGWILSTMEQKALGLSRLDPSEESVDPESKIDLRDAGMLRRLLAMKNDRRSLRKNSGDTGWEVVRDQTQAWGYGVSGTSGGRAGASVGAVAVGETEWVDFGWFDDGVADNVRSVGLDRSHRLESCRQIESDVWTLP